MTAPQVLTTLLAKQKDIQTYIRDLDKRLAQAKHDLAHVSATIRLFEVGDDRRQFPAYVNLKGLYRKGELTALCLEALGSLPERSGDSRQIAAYIIAKKGWDASDRALAVSVGHGVVSTLGARWRRGLVEKLGKVGGAVQWRTHREQG
jgi:hypothetical protein